MTFSIILTIFTEYAVAFILFFISSTGNGVHGQQEIVAGVLFLYLCILSYNTIPVIGIASLTEQLTGIRFLIDKKLSADDKEEIEIQLRKRAGENLIVMIARMILILVGTAVSFLLMFSSSY